MEKKDEKITISRKQLSVWIMAFGGFVMLIGVILGAHSAAAGIILGLLGLVKLCAGWLQLASREAEKIVKENERLQYELQREHLLDLLAEYDEEMKKHKESQEVDL